MLFYVRSRGCGQHRNSRPRDDAAANERIVGPYQNFKVLPFPGAMPVSALGPLSIESRDVIIGGADLWGQEAWRCAEY